MAARSICVMQQAAYITFKYLHATQSEGIQLVAKQKPLWVDAMITILVLCSA
jgi:hypothetical protein